MEDELLTKTERAKRILLDLFAKRDRIAIRQAVEVAGRYGISRRTLTIAAGQLDLEVVRRGPHPGFWKRPTRPTGAPLTSQLRYRAAPRREEVQRLKDLRDAYARAIEAIDAALAAIDEVREAEAG